MQTDLNFTSVYFGNTVTEYLYAIGSIIAAWIILRLIKKWVLSRVKQITAKSKTNLDDVLVSTVENFVIPYVYIVINFTIINQLSLSARTSHILKIAITVITIYYAVRLINHALHYSVRLYMQRRNEAEARIFQLNGILNVIKVLVWALGFLFLLDNLGYNVTTIIAGLGIGGIAIALAAQNILSDLFSYFVIFFDKPFEIGDFVVAGAESGTVEQIGIKTSRIRTLGGEELVMPNAELVKTPIHNFKRQQTRRVLFNIKVVYRTDAAALRSIPGIVKKIISAKEKVLFDRAHLQGLADYYINYEVVYNIQSADYNLYMDLHQAICLELIDAFKNEGIDFAIPSTETVFVKERGEKNNESNIVIN